MLEYIKIDYDRKRVSSLFYKQFIKLFVNLLHAKNIKIDKIDIKESRKGFHILIKLNKKITVEESLLFSLILYSDRTRELYNYCRHLYGKSKTFNFFSKRKVLDCNGVKIVSVERDTRRSRKIKRKLIKLNLRIMEGDYSITLGKYF